MMVLFRIFEVFGGEDTGVLGMLLAGCAVIVDHVERSQRPPQTMALLRKRILPV